MRSRLYALRGRRVPRLLVVAGVGLLVGVAALAALEEAVRRAAVRALEARIAAPVRIEHVDVNLLVGRARVSNLVVGSTEAGSRPILRLPALDVGLSYPALLRGGLVVRYLAFDKPELLIERTGPERVSVVELLRPGEGGAAAAVTLERLEVRGGQVTFVDRTYPTPFERTFTAVHLTTGRLSTLPELSMTPTSFELRMQIEEGSLTIAGGATPLGQPAGIELTARMENLDPAVLKAYLPAWPKLDLTGSRVSGEVRYVLSHAAGQVQANFLTARVETGGARLLAPDDPTPVLAVAGLAARDVHVDFLTQQARVGEVVVRQPHLLLQRGPGGTFNVARLAPTGGPPAAAPPHREPTGAGPLPLVVEVAHARLEGGTVEFRDHGTTPPVTTALRDVRLALDDIRLASNAKPGRVTGEARLESAPVQLTGTLSALPLAARLRLTARGVPLQPFHGYVNAALGTAHARGGEADGRLEIVLAPARAGGVGVELAGTLEGRNLSLELPGAAEPILTTRRLTVALARLGVSPAFEADLARVRLEGATLRVERDREGSLNLQRLWARTEPAGPARRPETPPAGSPNGASPVAIRHLELAQGRIELVDQAVTPAFSTELSSLRGELRRTPERADRMQVRVDGKLGQSAPLEVRGWMTPPGQPLRLGVQATIRDYELSRLSAYAEQYVSYRIRRGRVTTEVDYRYDGGQFAADNDIRIRHLQLGEPLNDEFHQRIGIPLEFALSLLENADGEIHLRLPVTGNADGPQVSYRGVIWEALQGAIVKAVAAPFRLFGTILTVGGKIGQVRIDPIEFLPGSLEPDGAARDRLATVIEFLKDKPRIRLQLQGRASSQEVEGLQRERLRAELKALPATSPEDPLTQLYQAAGGPVTRDRPATADMEQYLLERIPVTEEDLRQLAEERGEFVADTLVRLGVDPGRLFVATPGPEGVTDSGPGLVEFELL